ALAAGSLTGAAAGADLVVGSALAGRATPLSPTAGEVRLYRASLAAVAGDVTVFGAKAGDQLGAALATGDLDGDGKDDLVVGAPGAQNGAGAVLLFSAASQWFA